ncbi:Huntingtin-interacting protein K [Armadillidium nasatum]|uniref:Huntingtin-interacting protein K n=1 Tax=Armadillidium nasatum TaxID=96803 RepID=A0A5N5TMZ8_9CRUS|nr:Huntingtin-interacting protein K [Armadillidium nasatum]
MTAVLQILKELQIMQKKKKLNPMLILCLLINDVKRQEAVNKMTKEKELAKVSIKKEDVELIMQELELPKNKAERALREHQGNLIETLITLTN